MRNDVEIKEWLAALDSVVEFNSSEQAQEILTAVVEHAQQLGLNASSVHTPYFNTLPAEAEAKIPTADIPLIKKLEAFIRWNAIAIVKRAGKMGS